MSCIQIIFNRDMSNILQSLIVARRCASFRQMAQRALCWPEKCPALETYARLFPNAPYLYRAKHAQDKTSRRL